MIITQIMSSDDEVEFLSEKNTTKGRHLLEEEVILSSDDECEYKKHSRDNDQTFSGTENENENEDEEDLLQLLIHVVDAELSEAVLVEDLEVVDVFSSWSLFISIELLICVTR